MFSQRGHSASLGRIIVSVAVKRTKADGVSTENLRYYYVKNLQGDITAIVNGDGVKRAEYTYDEWGNLTSKTDGSGNTLTDKSNIGLLKPLRYRGYVYDTDTGLYHLQSRYYDPVTCRFINGASGTVLSYNLFAYCENNPLSFSDNSGQFGTPIQWGMAVVGGIAGWFFGDYVAKKLGFINGISYWYDQVRKYK